VFLIGAQLAFGKAHLQAQVAFDLVVDRANQVEQERPLGVFSRQLVLADTLDTEHIQADYEAGVLTLRIPIAERAKPRKITIGVGSGRKEISG